jgi:hypothetical protein
MGLGSVGIGASRPRNREWIGVNRSLDRRSIIMDSIRNRSVVRSCSRRWVDPVGIRDEMKRYQARSDQKGGTLSPFFIPEEKPPLYSKKEFPTSKEGTGGCQYFPLSFIIYDRNIKRSIQVYRNNCRKSHHAAIYAYAA